MLKKIIFLCTFLMAALNPLARAHPVVLGDANWDSVKFHNAVVQYIGENAYDLNFKIVSGSAPIVHAALMRGDVDLNMELWTDNTPTYPQDIKSGRLVDLGINFDDNRQGIYVPRYVVEGDPRRNIKALAPDLKTVRDLKKYAHLFPSDDNSNRARLYGAVPGWQADMVMHRKYEAYGLDENYVYFRSGSEVALFTAFMSAYSKGEPIVGYCYEPTWLTGKLDLVLLEDAPYEPQGFIQGLTAARAVPVKKIANIAFPEKQPEFVEFIKKYRTSSALTAEALAYMSDQKASPEEAAVWFLNQHPELLLQWLPADKLALVQQALKEGSAQKKNYLLDFPDWRLDFTQSIDNFVKYLNAAYGSFFDQVKLALSWSISSLEYLLNLLPWWLTIVLTVLIGKKLTGKLYNGLLYGLGLFLIGLFGYWEMMNETLAIIFAAVVISLLLGLPLGILVSTSKLANQLLRPLLDAMQTMPTFVYMIPAVMLLGPGKVPAVLATVVYAVVPVIRLTSHGIQQVDQEIVEASNAFGASRWQTLFKVQIPQALPTIMAGINQTMMMAVAMVVTCAMIGANGLGMEVLIAINRTESGRGLIAGLSIVIIAIIIDRLTQSLTRKKED